MKKEQKKPESLENFFGDRNLSPLTDFSKIADKSGTTLGYVAVDKGNNSEVMIKKAYQESSGHLANNDFIREFIMAPFYLRLLYNRTPVIALATGPKDEKTGQSEIYLRSKFLDNFQTFAALSHSEESEKKDIGAIERNLLRDTRLKQELSDTDGFEKIFAAILFLGDTDPNRENLGIVTMTDKKGSTRKVVAKIDHGKSATTFYTPDSEPKMRERIFDYLTNTWRYGNVANIHLDKLAISLEEILKISEVEIENFVDHQMHQLQTAGFDFAKVDLHEFSSEWSPALPKLTVLQNTPERKSQLSDIRTFIRNFFVKNLKSQLKTVKDLHESLKTIQLISPVEKDWIESKWIYTIKGEDPIVWAIQNNKNIAKMPPLFWAIQNNKNIAGQSPILWALKNNKKEELQEFLKQDKTTNTVRSSITELYVALHGQNRIALAKSHIMKELEDLLVFHGEEVGKKAHPIIGPHTKNLEKSTQSLELPLISIRP